MLSYIIYSLSFKMIYIIYLGQKRGGPGPLGPPSKSATVLHVFNVSWAFFNNIGDYLRIGRNSKSGDILSLFRAIVSGEHITSV